MIGLDRIQKYRGSESDVLETSFFCYFLGKSNAGAFAD